MVAKLVLAAVLLAVLVTVVLVAGFRYLDRRAQRRHERQLAREERDYELLMDEIESERNRSAEVERDENSDP